MQSLRSLNEQGSWIKAGCESGFTSCGMQETHLGYASVPAAESVPIAFPMTFALAALIPKMYQHGNRNEGASKLRGTLSRNFDLQGFLTTSFRLQLLY
jgi:hypothetical protein